MDTGYSKIVKEQHIRFSVKQNNVTITGIGFGMANKYVLMQQKPPIDIVFKIDENEWNGQKSLQLRVIDIRTSLS
jgi:single-stranded-DNA-specific exonuclease